MLGGDIKNQAPSGIVAAAMTTTCLVFEQPS